MKNPQHTRLEKRIAQLQAETKVREQRIEGQVQQLVNSIHPASLARESIHELAEDEKVQLSATKASLKVASRYVLFKVLRRFGGVYAGIGAAVIGSLSDTYMQQLAPKLIGVASGLFSKKDKGAEVDDEQNLSGKPAKGAEKESQNRS